LYSEAADHLERAAASAPDGEVVRRAYYKLSQVYHKLQRPADARNALARYQKLQEQKDKQGGQQLEDWKKMNAGAAAAAAGLSQDNPSAPRKPSAPEKPEK